MINKYSEISSTTFSDNMSLPIHKWYRYSAGFSAKWIEDVVKKYVVDIGSRDIKVLDPFAGSGTTLLACDNIGVQSFGYESHPLVSKIAQSKLLWNTSVDEFAHISEEILKQARQQANESYDYPEIVLKCYDEKNLKQIDSLRKTLEQYHDGSDAFQLSWVAFVSILRCASHAGTATWQYVLPNKKKLKVADAFEAYKKQIDTMKLDMITYQNSQACSMAQLFKHDARELRVELKDSIDIVVTSPPYANNYDYADATRLEMSVLGKVNGWGDLQSLVRPGLVRSCSQMVSREKKFTYDIINDPMLNTIRDELYEVCKTLDGEKELHGGKKNYHTMLALYFLDLAKVWTNLRAVCKDGATVCFVIGDSAPYGIYVPVDEWLGRLAISAGFKNYYFEKTRDRNTKWKNRKHTVPLKEGRLWIEG